VVATTVGDVLGRRDRAAVPGLALSVFERGEASLWCDGITSIADPLPVTQDTLFQLGSVSKVVTATAVVALVARGMLSLDDLVGPLLPSVDFGGAERSLTVEHLLSHRGGWQGDWSLFNAPASHDTSSLATLVSRARDVPRHSPPGGPVSYDNFGYCVAGALVEALTGEPFDRAVRSLVFEPLGMTNSVYWADHAIWKRVALGHACGGRSLAAGSEPWADRFPTRRALWPQGGVVASLADTVKLASYFATNQDDGPLSPALAAEMQKPRGPSGGQGTHVGLGWHIRCASGEPVLTHTGAAQGSFARVLVVPGRASAMAVLTNSASGPSQVDDLYDWYLRDHLGLVPEAPESAAPPPGADRLLGTYTAVTRTIDVIAVDGESAKVRVQDTGPTWAGDKAYRLRFAVGSRLVSDQTQMEYGALEDVPWVRFRGRIHVREAAASPNA